MDFFEEINRNFNNTKSKLTNKANTFFATSELESKQRELLKVIEQKYLKLGKTVFDTEGGDKTSRYSELIESIIQTKNELTDLEKEIESIKSKIRCPVCGNEIAEGSLFCSKCGSRIIPKDEDGNPQKIKVKYCPNCGLKLSENAEFCFNCGTKLN